MSKKSETKFYIYIKTFYVGYQIPQEKNLFFGLGKKTKNCLENSPIVA
jgi:hypothetical protein